MEKRIQFFKSFAEADEGLAIRSTHSTAAMAARVAAEACARRLLITHFSPRYFPGNETGPAAVTFTVNRTGDAEVAQTVTVATANGTASAGTDYTAVAGQVLTFTQGQTSATFTVAVTDDALFEGGPGTTETVTV